MATTLTDSGEITHSYVTFPIEKVESTPDGDLMVYGRATDGSVDHDQQIVDPGFSSKAISEWLATGGNVRVQHNPQRDPAGVGVEATSDTNGTWVKALIVEPIAKKLVSKGVLRAYSVGIANPTIERDITGKARGGIIKSGKIVEISLVDRPANASCGFQLVKSADDGTPEYSGEVIGSEADIQKALTATKDVESHSDVSDFDPMSINFTPNDLMRIMQDKIVKQHYSELAGKAKELVAKSDSDFDYDKGGALPEAVAVAKNDTDEPEKVVSPKEAVPDVVKDPDDADGEDGEGGGSDPTPGDHVPPKPKKGGADNDKAAKPAKPKKGGADNDKAAKPAKPKKGKKLPPWLNKPTTDGDADDDAAKGAKTDPKTASGAEEPHDMTPAPLGELVDSPAKPHMKMAEAAMMRFKTIGIDTDLGILHDMTCPAFHPEEVAKYFPFADFSTVDEELWQRKALAAATGKSLSDAMEAQQAWQAVVVLKHTDPRLINDFRVEAYKAFRDANPGPTSFPNPGTMSPTKYNRPCITDGHAQHSEGYGSPNSGPRIPDTTPGAHSFGRPPLSAAHQSPSPSHMKADFPYPEPGVPTKLNYGQIENEKARRSLSMLHDHLMHMFPSTCPMLDQDAYRVEAAPQHSITQVKTPTAEETSEVLGDVYKYIEKLEKRVRAGIITEAQAREKLSKRTARRYAESLSKQVQKGITSRDEVLKALGLPVSADAPAEVKLTPVATPDPVVKSEFNPEIMKTMMSEILQPFEQQITAQNARIEELVNENNEYRQKVETQQAQHQQRWDALASQGDPLTAGFSGLAINPARNNGPAGIVKQAEMSERVQGMMMRQLERTWRTSDNPAEREAAYNALCKYKGSTD